MATQNHTRLTLYPRHRVVIIIATMCLLGALLVVSSLIERQGVTSPLDWHRLVGAPPARALPHAAVDVQGVAIVMRQIAEPDAYALYHIPDGALLSWLNADPLALAPGDYLFIIQADGTFDTTSYRAFRIR